MLLSKMWLQRFDSTLSKQLFKHYTFDLLKVERGMLKADQTVILPNRR